MVIPRYPIAKPSCHAGAVQLIRAHNSVLSAKLIKIIE